MPQAFSGSIAETNTYLNPECTSVEQRFVQVFKNILAISVIGFLANIYFFLMDMPSEQNVVLRVAFYLVLAISCKFFFACMMNCVLSLKSMKAPTESRIDGYGQLPCRMLEFLQLAADKSTEQVAQAYTSTFSALAMFAFANSFGVSVIIVLLGLAGYLARHKTAKLINICRFNKVSEESLARYQEKIALILMSQ